MLIYFDDDMLIKNETEAIITLRVKSVNTTTERCWTEVTVGDELTRSLCGPGQILPRSIRLCSPSPPDRVDAVCKARSSSPNKHAPSPCRSNSGSEDGEEEVVLIAINRF